MCNFMRSKTLQRLLLKGNVSVSVFFFCLFYHFINLIVIGSSTQNFNDDFDFSSVDGDQVFTLPPLAQFNFRNNNSCNIKRIAKKFLAFETKFSKFLKSHTLQGLRVTT